MPDLGATHLEYEVLGGPSKSAELLRGEVWTFGRSNQCTETLVLPELSRTSLVLHQVDDGVTRVVSRQSNRGRVVISADDGGEQHVIGLGSAPVHLTGGNYTLKLELPPIVLRMHVAVPVAVAIAGAEMPAPRRAGVRPNEATALNWVPEPGRSAGPEWIAVAALAVAVVRYPVLSRCGDDTEQVPVSEALRRAAAAWSGHSSHYWVNERLKEAVVAADLQVPDGAERLRLVASHYAQFFSDATIRTVREVLLARQA